MIAAALLSSASSSTSSSSLKSSSTMTTTTTAAAMKTEQQVRTLIPVTTSDGSKLFVSGPCIVLKTQTPAPPQTVAQQMQALRPLLKADTNNGNARTAADLSKDKKLNNDRNNNNNNNNNNASYNTTVSKKSPGSNNLENEPEPLRCKRRIDFTSLGLPRPQPAAMARRNERERNRVKQVNLGFETLRQHVPQGRKNKKLSKVDTLKEAVKYISYLHQLLMEAEEEDADTTSAITDTIAMVSRASPITTTTTTTTTSLKTENTPNPSVISSTVTASTNTSRIIPAAEEFMTMTATTPVADGSSPRVEFFSESKAMEFSRDSAAAVEFSREPTTTMDYSREPTAMEFSREPTTMDYSRDPTTMDYSREPTTMDYSREPTAMEFSREPTAMEFSSDSTPNSVRPLPEPTADFLHNIKHSPVFSSLDNEASEISCTPDNLKQLAQFTNVQDFASTNNLQQQQQRHHPTKSFQEVGDGSPCHFLELAPAQINFSQEQTASSMDIDHIRVSLQPNPTTTDLAAFNATTFHHSSDPSSVLNFMNFTTTSSVSSSGSSPLDVPDHRLGALRKSFGVVVTTGGDQRCRGSDGSCPVSPSQSSGAASAGEEESPSSSSSGGEECLVVPECEAWQDLSADIAEWLCSKIDIDDPEVFV